MPETAPETQPDTVTSLEEKKLIRELKRLMPQTQPEINLSPFHDRITTEKSSSDTGDVTDIHAVIREHIRDTLRVVREGKKQSQVILIAGQPGVGKTHLIRTFSTADSMAENGHIFVGSNNHWKISEFEPYLLDRVITALVSPSPSDEHPMLDRIRAIAFQALEHMLSNPLSWKKCRKRRFWNRLLFRPSAERLREWTKARNDQVFSHLDFGNFAEYVCDRFLAERSNLQHRQALKVLLMYLFPEGGETTVEVREKVIHWFRGREHKEYFERRLGNTERPDRAFTQMEAIKLLVHLFSPHVSQQLNSPQFSCHTRVFLLAFDQAEGRNELFETEDEWKNFFAHLSELYNTLPNIVVLFSMTVALRTKLHSSMERQFMDRIRMDEKLILNPPSKEQIALLYRQRLTRWLQPYPDLADQYRKISNPYLPFQARDLEGFTAAPVRTLLEKMDQEFREKLNHIAVDAALDFQYLRNELAIKEGDTKEWDYTADHLNTIKKLLLVTAGVIGRKQGLVICEHVIIADRYVRIVINTTIDSVSYSLTINLGRLGWHYKEPSRELIGDCLYNREKAKNFLWLVRPNEFKLDIEERYREQVVTHIADMSVERTFRALISVNEKRTAYVEHGQEASLDELIIAEIDKTYLGKMLKFASEKLNALRGTS